MIPNCPDAEVSYNGTFIGNSSAIFTVKRKDANKVVLSVNHPSYDPRVYTFDERSFRGWAFVGTLLFWTGSTSSGMLLPWGVLVDGLTGSWWKPSTGEAGVTKKNNRHYVYTLDYGLSPKHEAPKPEVVVINQVQSKDIASKLEEIKDLLDSGIITEEEYLSIRKRLLESYSE